MIQPGAATLWSLARLPGIRQGFAGYGLIESSRPLAVTVAEEPDAGSGLDLALYNALSANTGSGDPGFPAAEQPWPTFSASLAAGTPWLPLLLNVAPLPDDQPPLTPGHESSPTGTATGQPTPLDTATPQATPTEAGPATVAPGTPVRPSTGPMVFLPAVVSF